MTGADGTPAPVPAGATIVASLREYGVDRVFCVAGESYLPILDALHDEPRVDVVTCRHEGSAGFMALADARLAGRVGVALVSRGPGAANATIAVHAAREDGAPLLLVVGGVPRRNTDRDPFQGVDCGRLFGGIAKAVWTLHDPADTAEFVARAVRTAESGTPGPVVLTVPEDVIGRADPLALPACRAAVAPPRVGAAELGRAAELMAGARRPLLIAGPQLDHPRGRHAVRAFAERHAVPVVTANKCQHLLPNRHPHYAGHLHNATPAAQAEAFGAADVILAVGTALDGTTTLRRRLPARGQTLIHVHTDPARLDTYHPVTLGAVGDPATFLTDLTDAPAVPDNRAEWIARLHRIEADKAVWRPVTAPDGVVFGEVAAALDELTGGRLTLVVDSGTFTSWLYRYVRFDEGGRLLGVASSAMGFAVGAGVAAGLRDATVPTVAVVGDGGLVMNLGELTTAVQRQVPVTYVVADNRSYGTIRLHQERDHPGRSIGTELANPDFARLAEAFGALAFTVQHPDDVRPCLVKALACPGPALVWVRTSLEFITAYRRLSTVSDTRHAGGGAS